MLVIILRITQHIALRFTDKTCRFNLSAHSNRANAMQCVGSAKFRAGFGNVIDHEEDSVYVEFAEDSTSGRARGARRTLASPPICKCAVTNKATRTNLQQNIKP